MKSDFFIEPECFEAIEGGTLFYPAAGQDYTAFWNEFAFCINEFRFADINYDFGRDRSPFRPLSPGSEYRLVQRRLEEDATAKMERCATEWIQESYRFLKPAHLIQLYERCSDGRKVTVILRRGFGQYALAELEERSIQVFVHRCDSQGEGGSNVYFLANRNGEHETCRNLFDKLTRKLAPRALIISDGSNTDIDFLGRFHRQSVEGCDAYRELRDRVFWFGGRSWRCVGYMRPKGGPTLVWAADLEGKAP